MVSLFKRCTKRPAYPFKLSTRTKHIGKQADKKANGMLAIIARGFDRTNKNVFSHLLTHGLVQIQSPYLRKSKHAIHGLLLKFTRKILRVAGLKYAENLSCLGLYGQELRGMRVFN